MTRQRFRELLDRYLANASTPDERRLVDEYLGRLETVAAEDSDHIGDEELRQAIWDQIRSKAFDEIPVVKMPWYRTRFFRMGAVAASVLLTIITLSISFQQENPVKKDLSVASEQVNTPISALRHLANTSGRSMSIQLPDSSIVDLQDKSELTYKEPFVDDRQIMLVGEADFTVTKNKSKPFRVTSNAIVTTALGTRFTVTSKVNTENITVKLFEGSVLIQAVSPTNWRIKRDFYLKPGEEFIYTEKALARVRKFAGRSQAAAMVAEDSSADEPIIPENVSGSWYMFNNQALANVFDQLAFTYDVEIVYKKKDLANKYFVGRFNKTDSLDLILNYISVVNKLTVRKEDNTYYITK